MNASDRGLTVRDWRRLLHNTDVRARVKCCLPCSGYCMSVLLCISSEEDSLFVSVMKRWDTRRVLQHLGVALMGSCYPDLVRSLLSCIVCFVAWIPTSGSIFGCVTMTSIFVCVVTSGGYMPNCITSSYLQFPHLIAQFDLSRTWVGGNSWKSLVYYAFQRLQLLPTIQVTSWSIICIRIWADAWQHRSSLYGHSYRFSGWFTLITVRLFLVIVAYRV